MLPDTAASKVTAAHLSRTALLYVRQSSLKQVIHNTESAIRQYDLRGKAISLGWAADQITVIDIDQGHSRAAPRPCPPGPRPRRPGRPRAPVRHPRRLRVGPRLREGVQHRRPVLPLAAPGRTPQGRDRLEAAGPPRRAADPAQPPVRGRVHLR